MSINTKDFLVREGANVNLKKWPTRIDPVCESKEQYARLLDEHVVKLSSMQQLLYAINSHALLLIFQVMDAAGKDGAHQARDVRGQPAGLPGVQLQSLQRNRISARLSVADHLRAARAGADRYLQSILYYDEVLVVRVHRDILRREGLSDIRGRDKKLWHDRYRSIADLKQHLYVNGTRVIKVFLHLSKEEQRKRFLARIDAPDKNCKFSLADIKERGYWKHYMKAYEECLSATSTDQAPWFVVPADDKESAG